MLSLLFPGQGSQYAGMGKALCQDFAVCRHTFEEADDALGMKLSQLCFEGPEDELKRTELTQPAILTTSVAALRALQAEHPDLRFDYAAGHSLGEFSALVAVGALRFGDAVQTVRERGRLMQNAVPEGQGAMAAVLGLEADQVVAICQAAQAESGEVVAAANFNSKQQTVISGSSRGVELVSPKLLEAGAQKLVPLPVSAPFHCPLMAPAADGLKAYLEGVPVSPLQAPVIANVTAQASTDATAVKPLLVEQVTAPVRWVASMEALVEAGAHTCLEIGPGKVLMGLCRRIDRKLKVTPVGDPDGIKAALALA